jgi:hypothetical protein
MQSKKSCVWAYRSDVSCVLNACVYDDVYAFAFEMSVRHLTQRPPPRLRQQ